MITGTQILCHLFGDYILQSDWQAVNKTKSLWVAAVHGFFYSVPFLFLYPSNEAIFIIGLSHVVIDRFRLARYLCWIKNFLAPLTEWGNNRWSDCDWSGYRKDRPDWLKGWLLFLADNSLHILINGIALRYF